MNKLIGFLILISMPLLSFAQTELAGPEQQGSQAGSQEAAQGGAQGQGIDKYTRLFNVIKEAPGARVEVHPETGWTMIYTWEDEQQIVWSFTPEDHPAHPSFSTRESMQTKDGNMAIKTKLDCGSEDKRACDELQAQYDALDKQIKAALRGNQGGRNGPPAILTGENRDEL